MKKAKQEMTRAEQLAHRYLARAAKRLQKAQQEAKKERERKGGHHGE